MVKLDLQYDLANNTPASASPPQANFSRTEQYVNQELINRDGSVSMNAQLQLVGDPLTALDAAPKQYVDGATPVGSMIMFAGASAPAGGQWALCNGAELEQAAYPELYAVIGTTYGGASGHFNLPNLTNKFPMGGGTPGVTGGSADGAVVAHTHTINHTHTTASTNGADLTHSHGDDHFHTTGGMNTNQSHAHTSSSSLFVYNPFAPDFFIDLNGGGATAGGQQYRDATDSVNTDHSHSTNYKSQVPGQGTTTSNALGVHNHAVDVPAHAGASGPASNAAANANLPPYLTINYLIRAR